MRKAVISMNNQEMQFAEPEWQPPQQGNVNTDLHEQEPYIPQPINTDPREQPQQQIPPPEQERVYARPDFYADPQAEKIRVGQYAQPRRSTVLCIGLAFIFIGSCILLSGAQSHNILSNLAGAIFALFGVFTNYLQLFFPSPLFHPNSQLSSCIYSYEGALPDTAEFPASSSPIFFRMSGMVLLIGSIINTVFLFLLNFTFLLPNYLLTIIYLVQGLSFLLCLLGLPGFHIKQSHRAGWLSLSGVVLLCSSSLFYGIYLFLTINTPEQTYDAIYNTDNTLFVVGLILLGIAIIRASIFPRWTGVLLIASGIGCIAAFTPLYYANFSYVILFNIASILNCIAFIRCGYALLR